MNGNYQCPRHKCCSKCHSMEEWAAGKLYIWNFSEHDLNIEISARDKGNTKIVFFCWKLWHSTVTMTCGASLPARGYISCAMSWAVSYRLSVVCNGNLLFQVILKIMWHLIACESSLIIPTPIWKDLIGANVYACVQSVCNYVYVGLFSFHDTAGSCSYVPMSAEN